MGDLRSVVVERCNCWSTLLPKLLSTSPKIPEYLNQVEEISNRASSDPAGADIESKRFLRSLRNTLDRKGQRLLSDELLEPYLECAGSMKTVQCAAYHEAGHVVVATKIGVAMKDTGMAIDDSGRGHSSIELNYSVKREDHIIVFHAGFLAEKGFDRDYSGNSASDDLMHVRALQQEQPRLSDADIAHLKADSEKLVRGNCQIIEQLATKLLNKQYGWRRASGDLESEWKCDPEWQAARRLLGSEIQEVLPDMRLTRSFLADD